jgi:hypothetical protein
VNLLWSCQKSTWKMKIISTISVICDVFSSGFVIVTGSLNVRSELIGGV